MNPEGSLLPGVTTFAMTPATNPMMMVMPTALSHSSQAVPLRLRATEISANVAFSDRNHSPQGDVELMAEKQILGFEPASVTMRQLRAPCARSPEELNNDQELTSSF
jgi:hypothetical protein